MKKIIIIAASLACCIFAYGQVRQAPPQPTDGLKDAYKDYFMIGVAVNQRNVSDPVQAALIKREFNSLTAENDMKPQPTEPEYGKFNWERADRIADFCRQNGIKMRGHTLMWHQQIGTWMYLDKDGNLLPKEQFYANMKHHIQAIVSRYKDVVYAWDVVNEAVQDGNVKPGHNPMRQSHMYQIAGEEFIYKAFEYAHEADPNALLFYNEYGETDPGKSQRIYELVKRMKDAGVPVDGIGMQGHYSVYSPSADELDAALTLYSKIVDHIHITEMDISVDNPKQISRADMPKLKMTSYQQMLQDDQYRALFEVLRKHSDKIDCVTFWDLGDRDSWRGAQNFPLLFDFNYNVKSAYYAVKNFKDEKPAPVIKEDFKPSGSCQAGHEYPMVNSDGYVRFRIYAPDAKYVIVNSTGGVRLYKDKDGYWTGTSSKPADEGFHYYDLTIDGATIYDPNTKYYYGSSSLRSGLEVPAHDQDFYALKNVPHGNIQQVLFWSESTQTTQQAFVYTPPEYNGSKRSKYPVLYLQHGYGENEYAWWNQGKVNLIMDNLIAEGRIEPFIIVMAYGLTNEQNLGTSNFGAKDFEKVLCDELVPYIESHFRTYTDKRHRAMAGLSMGGMETHSITLARPELFNYYGLFSGGIYTPQEIKDPGQVKGIFIGCGSKENPEQVIKAVQTLKDAGFDARGYVSDGTAHEFLTWRRCFYEMAPMLFR